MNRKPFTMLMVALLIGLTSGSASAHDPTNGQGSEEYADYAELGFDWRPASVPPSWMDHVIESAAASANASNASRAPTFEFTGSGDDLIGYRLYSEGPCEPPQLACAKKFFDGTDDWRITFVMQGQQWGDESDEKVRWCDNPDTSANKDCWNVRRFGVHEFGHILDLAHNASPIADTVMQSSIAPFSTTSSLQRCDKARLQLTYDMRSTASTYADCLDGVPGSGQDGLLTDLTFATSDTLLCVGDAVTFSGNLRVDTVSSYEALSGNALGSRAVKVQRETGLSDPAFADVVITTTSSSGNWSAAYTSSAVSDRLWRARFPTGVGLNGLNTGTIRIRWTSFC